MAKLPPAKPVDEEEDGGVPEWVVTYGDMMSLLLTFFIMLVSMSEMKDDDGKARAMMDGIREAFGATPHILPAPGKSLRDTGYYTRLTAGSRRGEADNKKQGRKSEGASGAHQSADRINDGTVVTLGGPARFAQFDATLNDDLKQTLDIVANVIRSKPNRVVVRGHASPQLIPEGSPFADHMHLSFARARAASQYLISKGIDRDRLLVETSGDSEPRNHSRHEDRQRLNRRVDVFLIDSYISPR